MTGNDRVAYPAHREADVALRDGSTVHVRPIRPTDERLLKEESNLVVQTQLVETAKQHRDFRLAELLGGEKVAEGLTSQIAKAEDDRNAAQAEVDRLRRDVSNAMHHLQELAAKNKELARQLAGREVESKAETAAAGRD